AVPVTNGLFTTGMDFGAENLDGANLWLEMNVRTNGGGAFTTLSPRQSLTSTPYAVRALTASNLLGTLPASQISGAIPNTALPTNPSFTGTVDANSFSGDGANLTGVNAAALNGLTSDNFWKTTGNAGTTAGTHFLGTTDNQPLELKANNTRVLRFEPNTNDAPNIIAGSSLNRVLSSSVVGATISGGQKNLISTNADFGTIGGGHENFLETNSLNSTIGGGHLNQIRGTNIIVAGGEGNLAQGTGLTIGGGTSNQIVGPGGNAAGSTYGYDHTIAGGSSNFIFSSEVTDRANSIGGGTKNSIYKHSRGSTIGGGILNTIVADSPSSTIGGGYSNKVDTQSGTIAGGLYNNIDAYGWSGSTIGGGIRNVILTSSDATIGGGENNKIIGSDFGGGTIGGGSWNILHDGISALSQHPPHSGKTISGGYTNSIAAGAYYATIGGGVSNIVANSARLAFIPGGGQAKVSNYGQMAHASGQFQSVGDAQTSVYICRNITTNASPRDLFLDGISRFITVPTSSTWALDILVTARAATGSSAVYQIRSSIRNDAGVTTLFGTPALTIIGEDVPAWDVTVSANDTNDSLVLTATGDADQTIRWVATVRSVEVSF
ncbi:MAG: hypothetical protein AAB370_00270, partial [Verrucomicrobiota bacterium]